MVGTEDRVATKPMLCIIPPHKHQLSESYLEQPARQPTQLQRGLKVITSGGGGGWWLYM